jgi:hypothetical protein
MRDDIHLFGENAASLFASFPASYFRFMWRRRQGDSGFKRKKWTDSPDALANTY